MRGFGTALHEPFLPLPVIPHLRITDKGLVDVDKFALVWMLANCWHDLAESH